MRWIRAPARPSAVLNEKRGFCSKPRHLRRRGTTLCQGYAVVLHHDWVDTGSVLSLRRGERIIVGEIRGRLQVVATPIGNMNDVSARARQALGSAAAIAAEDTRHTGMLLQALGISR